MLSRFTISHPGQGVDLVSFLDGKTPGPTQEVSYMTKYGKSFSTSLKRFLQDLLIIWAWCHDGFEF